MRDRISINENEHELSIVIKALKDDKKQQLLLQPIVHPRFKLLVIVMF